MFAIPERRAYPIHDISHARNALARVAQHGTASEKARVRAAVYARYPSIKRNKVKKVRGAIPNKPGVSNWVEDAGGLPAYIDDVAGSLFTKRGFTVSRAIATAVSKMKKWCAGGDNVKPKTQAKACRAVAQWEKMRAKAGVKDLRKDDKPRISTSLGEVDAVLSLSEEDRRAAIEEADAEYEE